MISNVKIENLDVLGHIDKRVAIVVTDSEAGYKGVLHIFMNNKALSAWLLEKRTKYPNLDFRYIEDYLGTAVNFVINNNFEGISIHSVVETSFDVLKEDLMPLADVVDSFCQMSRFGLGRISIAELAAGMRNKNVYYVGNKPQNGDLLTKKDMIFGLTMMKRKMQNGEYEALATFLTAQSALQYADKAVQISESTLSELATIAGGLGYIVLEPMRSFSVEFSPIAFL